MKFKNPLIVVKDIEKSKIFYKEVLGLRTISDLGANAVLTGGLALQTEQSFKEFIGKDITYCSNEYVHPVKEHSWGQKVVRFYDPDHHIIEVGENMKTVCKRYLDKGMTLEEIAEKMDIPLKAVKAYTR